MVLTVSDISKSYGTVCALNKVSFTLGHGVYALLGPNGAGKTTLMNLLTQNLLADSGEILCDGTAVKPSDDAYRMRLGYMPQQQRLMPRFTVERFLYYMAALKGLSHAHSLPQIEELLTLCNLQEHRGKRLGALSGGMKQRALLAQALLGHPELLILDEPTAGLDPKERIRIRNLIARAGMDRTILFATHVVSDVEYIAKEVLFLQRGDLIEQGTVEQVYERMANRVWSLCIAPEYADEALERYRVSGISRRADGVHIRIVSDTPPEAAIPVSPGLDDMYLWLYGADA